MYRNHSLLIRVVLVLAAASLLVACVPLAVPAPTLTPVAAIATFTPILLPPEQPSTAPTQEALPTVTIAATEEVPSPTPEAAPTEPPPATVEDKGMADQYTLENLLMVGSAVWEQDFSQPLSEDDWIYSLNEVDQYIGEDGRVEMRGDGQHPGSLLNQSSLLRAGEGMRFAFQYYENSVYSFSLLGTGNDMALQDIRVKFDGSVFSLEVTTPAGTQSFSGSGDFTPSYEEWPQGLMMLDNGENEGDVLVVVYFWKAGDPNTSLVLRQTLTLEGATTESIEAAQYQFMAEVEQGLVIVDDTVYFTTLHLSSD